MVIVLTSSVVDLGSGIMVIVLASSAVDRGFWYNGYRARGFWYNSYRAHVECGRSWVLV